MNPAPYTVEDHIALRRVGAIAASPDGRWLAVAVQRLDADGAKYVSDLWRVPTDGGATVQLTRGDSKESAPCFRPDGALAFLSNRKPQLGTADEDADQRMQIWLLPAEGGEPRQLTDEPLGVEAFRFAPHADRLIYTAPVIAGVAHEDQRKTAAERTKKGPSVRRYTEQPVRHWDHWLHENDAHAFTHLIACDAEGGGRTDLTPGARRELAIEPAFDVKPDGCEVALTWQSLGADRELDTALAIIDAASGALRLVAPGAAGNLESPRYAPDGQLYALHSARSAQSAPQPRVVRVAADGALTTLAAHWDGWPAIGDFSADSRTLFFAADHDGHVPVFALDLEAGSIAPWADTLGGGAHGELAALPDGRLACVRSTLLDAPECHVIAAHTGTAPLARLSGFTPATAWAEIERIDVPSTDGTRVQAWITRPRHATGPLPVLLWIHGGPIGMSSDGWHWRWNALLAAAQGYMVVQPNPRGSTGFGQAFIQGIWGNVWGAQCYADLMAVTDAIEARPDADADAGRIMAMGGSFGGYMSNWIGTQTDRFKCLITHASIVTMAQFTGTTDHPAWWYLELGGENPYAGRERFDRYAPIAHITQWKTPTLIIHGERDYRCPVGEALNLFEALRYHAVPAELMIFPDENHWILKPRNIVAWYEGVLDYLARHLRG